MLGRAVLGRAVLRRDYWRTAAVAAVWSTRVGIRMRWWIEGASGSDARGPISVRSGSMTAVQRRDDPGG